MFRILQNDNYTHACRDFYSKQTQTATWMTTPNSVLYTAKFTYLLNSVAPQAFLDYLHNNWLNCIAYLYCSVLMLITVLKFYAKRLWDHSFIVDKRYQKHFFLTVHFNHSTSFKCHLSINILTAYSTVVTRLANIWQDVENGLLSVANATYNWSV